MAGALPIALAQMGHDVSLFVPLYRSVDRKAHSIKPSGKSVSIPVSARMETGSIFSCNDGSITVYFIGNDKYFDRGELYNTKAGDYADNAERFSFFSLATLEAIKTLGLKPDVIHVNDWQTALIPVYLKTRYGSDKTLKDAISVLTIHNLGYQGLFPADQWHLLGLLWDELYNSDGLEYFGHINFLKGGIIFSDILTTVSPTYADEIQRPGEGAGLDGLLREYSENLFGILNGIDIAEWNPATDPLIPANFSHESLGGKSVCKEKLLDELGLKPGGQPVVAIISRLVEQKGIDLIIGCLDEIMTHDLKFVLLGSGQRKYEKIFSDITASYPGKAAVRIGFDAGLSHRIEAGADIFVMPSRYEPCGLTQMYSLAYGAVPLVRATGGLNDTVRQFDPENGTGNGFKFSGYSSGALYKKVCEALNYYSQAPDQWRSMVQRGMREDHSWKESARMYEELYKNAMENRKPPQ